MTLESTGEPNPQKSIGESATSVKVRRASLIVVCVLLVLPVVFMVFHHKQSRETASEPVDSIDSLEQAARLHPTADNRLNLSLAYINAHRQTSALPILNGLIAEDAANAKAWNNLCVVHNLQSEFNQAVDSCRRALTVDPGFQLAQNNLRWSEQQIQKARNAIATVDELPSSARTSELYVNEGLDNLHIGNYDRALEIWRQVDSKNPGNASIANDIGVAYMMKHNTPEAIRWFEKAQQLDPKLELAKNNLAWAHSVR